MKDRRAFLKEAGALTVLAPFMAQPVGSFAASPTGEEPAPKSREPLGFKPHPLKQGDGKGGWIVRQSECQFLHPFPGKGKGGAPFGVAQMDNEEVALMSSWNDGGEWKKGKAEKPVITFSRDGGRTWTDFQRVDESEDCYGRPMTLTYLGKGQLSFVASWRGQATRYFSPDYGRTWPERVPVPLEWPDAEGGKLYGTEGNPLVDRDAQGGATRIAELFWYYRKGNKWPKDPGIEVIRWSSDGGRTWGEPVTPQGWTWQEEQNGKTYTRGCSEGSLVRAANGWIVAALRPDMPARYLDQPNDDSLEGTAVSISKDNGKTWSPLKFLYDAGRHHAHLLRMPNGDLVMTLIVRDDVQNRRLASYRRGCDALVSRDNGLTWDLARKYILDDFEYFDGVKWYNGDTGHLYSTLLSDGYILTCYGNYLTHGACVIRWKPASR